MQENLCYLDWKFNKSMLKYLIFFKNQNPYHPYAFLKLILIFCTVPDSIVKFLSYILAFLKVIINSYSFHVCPKVSLLVSDVLVPCLLEAAIADLSVVTIKA